jgi:hypothetical protein
MALLTDVLRVSGGLDLWRQLQRFTLHLSIGGALCLRRYRAARLKELVVDGTVHEQSLEITGFNASDRRALYRADRIALEGADGRRFDERHASPAEFRSQLKSSAWDELQLAYYCGYLIWNYLSAPFILSGLGFRAQELEPLIEQGESWRRLRVEFPARVVTHAAEQVFYFDRDGYLRRLDYAADFENGAPVAQLFSGHQRFSGILVPTLCRMLSIEPVGVSAVKSSWVDIEIFDAVFER